MARIRVNTLLGGGTTATPAAVPTCALTTSGTTCTWGSNPGIPTLASGDSLRIVAEPDTPNAEVIDINGPYTAGSLSATGVTRNAAPTQLGQNSSAEHTAVSWVHTPTAEDYFLPFVVVKAAAYSAERNDVVLATAGSGGFAVTAPTPAANAIFGVKKVDNGAGSITIAPHGTETFDGSAAGRTLIVQNDIVYYISDGTNWYEIDATVASAAFESAVMKVRLDQLLAPGNPVNFGGYGLIDLGAGVVASDAARMDQTNTWIQDSNTWTRVGNWEFSVPVNTSIYGAGMCAKWKESGVQKYGVISSSTPGATTNVFLANTTDYQMAVNPDAGSMYYSFGVPRDVPQSFTWSNDATTGFTGSINYTYRTWSILPGRHILVCIGFSGTSNATSMTSTLPIQSASTNPVESFMGGLDSGTPCKALGQIPVNSSTLTWIKFENILAPQWTNSGTKGAGAQMLYPV